MKPELTITIASLPDRENLVAELWFGDVQWGEINQEGESLTLEIYPHRSGKPWVFDLDDVIQQVEQAKSRLEERTLAPV
jgi:hypothetical protein